MWGMTLASHYRSRNVDIPRSQISVANQATRGIWSVHCIIAFEGESPEQYYCCPALPKPYVSAACHRNDGTMLPDSLIIWKIKEIRVGHDGMS